MAGGLIIVLVFSETVLIFDVFTEFYGLYFEFHADHHVELEMLAVFVLGFSLIVSGVNFWRILRENRDLHAMRELASGAFLRALDGQLGAWNLSESEREIALLLIKGLSIQEITGVRSTKPGTIKSQCNAIYRKAGVKGRYELVAYFVEDLMGGMNLTTEEGPRYS